MRKLKIDNEFRDKVPPLTETELKTLEENIVKDGRVLVPIITWNETIIDGHNRYSIVQKHPEIPFDVVEREFADRYEAIVWICRNQLGRRNLTDEQKSYLIGKQYEAQKMTVGAPAENENAKKQLHQSDVIEKKRSGTAANIAKEHGIGEVTVLRSEKFAKGVDEAEKAVPGTKDKILSGEVSVPRSVVAQIPQMEPEEKDEIISMIASGKYEKPKGEKPRGWTKADRASRALTEAIVAEMCDTEHMPEFTLELLIEDIQLNGETYVQLLRNTLVDRSNLLTEENKPIIAEAIEKYVISKIKEVKELVKA